MDNFQRLEQCKILAERRNLPVELREKIRFFFKNLRIPFENLKENANLVEDLPKSLQEEIALCVNNDVIKAVGFIDSGSPAFVKRFARDLKPVIAIVNDYLVQREELATRMFFIQAGICEVLANDEQSCIRFLTKGEFFGEVGCLITGKRTCSVVARSCALMFIIKCDNLLAVLDDFPDKLRQLREIANERVRVVDPLQIDAVPSEIQKIEMVLQRNVNAQTIFGTQNTANHDNNLPDVHAEFLSNMHALNRMMFIK